MTFTGKGTLSAFARTAKEERRKRKLNKNFMLRGDREAFICENIFFFPGMRNKPKC